jgi:putative phosphoesterase
MKIAIVADTHNNWKNFEKAINWINEEKIKLVLHCGDIQSQEIIDQAEKLYNGNMMFVKGNGDFGLDLPESLELEFNGRKIGFVHFPEIAKKMAQTGKLDLVFYGHTHRPWDEKVAIHPKPTEEGGKETHMINPGELAGQFYKPTFAVYDTENGKLELKILENL